MPCSGCSALHEVNPIKKKEKEKIKNHKTIKIREGA